MVAPPGAGKGTQGTVIAQHFGVPHIATGDLLRDHVARGTTLGRQVRAHLARGQLVPDDVVLGMVRDALEAAPEAGYVLDGIPRTVDQARRLHALTAELGAMPDVALHLRVDDAELVRRLLARAVLEGRADDTEQVIRHRLALYHEVTHPVLDWYGERGILVTVDADRPAHLVGRHIVTALEVMRQMLAGRPDVQPRTIDLTGLGPSFRASA
jgi:adenylate kinase